MPDSQQSQGDTVQRSGGAPTQPAKQRNSMWRDPVVRTLAWVSVVLVILYLATIVGALFMGVMSPSEPRTRGERDVRYYEILIQKTPKDTNLWKSYIDSLVKTKQYLKAQDVIDRAKKSVDQKSTQDISAAQANLYIARKDYDAAIKTADDARKKLKAYYAEAVKKPGSAEAKGLEIHENYWDMLLVKSEALSGKGDAKGAIKVLDEYIKEKYTASDALVRRGQLKAEIGDKKGAEKDFRKALTFIPDDAAALEGLKQIGVEK